MRSFFGKPNRFAPHAAVTIDRPAVTVHTPEVLENNGIFAPARKRNAINAPDFDVVY